MTLYRKEAITVSRHFIVNGVWFDAWEMLNVVFADIMF
jgi:hypothetical protein